MSSITDCARNYDAAHNARFERMCLATATWNGPAATELIAGLIFLDREAEKDREDNVVVMTLGFVVTLAPFVTIVGAQYAEIVRQLVEARDAGREFGAELLTTAYGYLTQPFQVTFTHPRGEYVFQYIGGLTRLIRAMTQSEKELSRTGQLPAVFTTTAAGERIMV